MWFSLHVVIPQSTKKHLRGRRERISRSLAHTCQVPLVLRNPAVGGWLLLKTSSWAHARAGSPWPMISVWGEGQWPIAVGFSLSRTSFPSFPFLLSSGPRVKLCLEGKFPGNTSWLGYSQQKRQFKVWKKDKATSCQSVLWGNWVR